MESKPFGPAAYLQSSRLSAANSAGDIRLGAFPFIGYKSHRGSTRLVGLLLRIPMLRRTVLAALASLFWFGVSKASGQEQSSPALGKAAKKGARK